MQKVLWLASWYPSKIAPFDGDFVKRHAVAVARLVPVALLHVIKDAEGRYTKDVTIHESQENGLHEIIAYYKPLVTKSLLINKLISFIKFLALNKRIIRKHINENGLPDLVHVHVPMRAGIVGIWMKKIYKTPLMVSEHWCGYNHLNPDNFFKRSLIFRRSTKQILQSAELVTMVCEANRKELRSLFSLKKSSVITNVGDTDEFYYEAGEMAEFTFVHVSSLTYQKNIEGILQALASLGAKAVSWKLLVIGPYKQQQYELSRQLGLENFTVWLGEMPYRQVAFQVRKASSMIMFSRFENLPCTLVEALLCGLPVIASNVGGIPEIINESNGLLIESENIDQLNKAIRSMLTNYKNYDRREIAARAKERFSYEKVAQQFVKTYNTMCGCADVRMCE
ncbi:MAG: glycosyltransferase [Chitinophagaceae bacterium]